MDEWEGKGFQCRILAISVGLQPQRDEALSCGLCIVTSLLREWSIKGNVRSFMVETPDKHSSVYVNSKGSGRGSEHTPWAGRRGERGERKGHWRRRLALSQVHRRVWKCHSKTHRFVETKPIFCRLPSNLKASIAVSRIYSVHPR